MTADAPLLNALIDVVGVDRVRTDDATLRLFASDLHVEGVTPVAVIRPSDAAATARAVAAASGLGHAVVPRGGGLSYTGGYACGTNSTVVVDLGDLNRIVEICENDMIMIAESGVTWKQLYEALAPRGLRLPFFGTFSGAGATIGGGLSHGALFFGSARYGSAADNVLALEIATVNGDLLGTGQWALSQPSRPAYRGFGPDMTGLFLHDGGAFGIKTRAAFRLIRTPLGTRHASFAFPSFGAAARTLSAVARAGVAEDAYVLDPVSVAAASEDARGLRGSLAAARTIVGAANNAAERIRAILTLGRAVRSPSPTRDFSFHCVTAGTSRAAASADLATVRSLARRYGGRAVAATIPQMARAVPFPDLDGVLGNDGARWTALNAKVAHSESLALIEAHRRLIAEYEAAMTALGVRVTYLCSALGTHCFSFEAVFHWKDRWLPLHRQMVNAKILARRSEPLPNADAHALVDELREKTVGLFRKFGAASNQIGRTYPYMEILTPAAARLLGSLKAKLDPKSLMNPGVLGLGEG